MASYLACLIHANEAPTLIRFTRTVTVPFDLCSHGILTQYASPLSSAARLGQALKLPASAACELWRRK
eukprot:2936325-Amphidinium_carterae.1